MQLFFFLTEFFNLNNFKSILTLLIEFGNTNFTSDELNNLIERIVEYSKKSTDLHCTMVIDLLKKLLPKEEQEQPQEQELTLE